MSKPKKHPPPAVVRPKVGASRSRTKRLNIGQAYVSAQPQGDPQNKLATQIQAVSQTRTSLVALLGKKSDLKAQLTKNAGDIVNADSAYATALVDYASAGAVFAAGDASALSALGIAQAQTPVKTVDEILVAPVVKLAAGTADGQVICRCHSVPYAGAYQFEYKLEPSQPADPWLGNIATKLVATLVSGLAPAQLVRVRARAVGAQPGPWSVEVVGRAKARRPGLSSCRETAFALAQEARVRFSRARQAREAQYGVVRCRTSGPRGA